MRVERIKSQKCGSRIPSVTLDRSYHRLPRMPSQSRILLLRITPDHPPRCSAPSMLYVPIGKTATKTTKVPTSWAHGSPSPDPEIECPMIVPDRHPARKRRIPDSRAWGADVRISTPPTRSRAAKRVPRSHSRAWSGEDQVLVRVPGSCLAKKKWHQRQRPPWPTWRGCLCSLMRGCRQVEQ